MFHSPSAKNRTPGRRFRINKGIYDDGVWKCNCEPRLPAPLRTVAKENANKGRTFYTCPRSLCDFFLWSDEAARREPVFPSTPSRIVPQTPFPPPLPTPQTSPNKRSFEVVELSDDDDWVKLPRKESRTTAEHMSPNKPRDADVFTTPTSAQRTVSFTGGSVPTTPLTMGRTRRLLFPTPKSGMGTQSEGGGLESEVMEMLDDGGVYLPGALREKLQAVLRKHERQKTGLVKGREIVRKNLETKEVEILKLRAELDIQAEECREWIDMTHQMDNIKLESQKSATSAQDTDVTSIL